MSDSVRPCRRQPTRLRHPWESPGKNTGVGCHFLLQGMKAKSESEVAQSCLTLRDPMDCSLPGSSVHGILQARVLEWGAIAFSSYLGLVLSIFIHNGIYTSAFIFLVVIISTDFRDKRLVDVSLLLHLTFGFVLLSGSPPYPPPPPTAALFMSEHQTSITPGKQWHTQK